MSNTKAVRRRVSPLSLAFLDVMFCGFGAVILIFLILDHATNQTNSIVDPTISAEIKKLETEVLEGQEGLLDIRNTVDDISLEIVTAQGRARQIQEQINTFLQELAALENSSTASIENIEKLRADVESLKEELLRLQASALDQKGDSVRQFLGDGSRQYLSGLYLGGQRILILVDTSASMLDETLVNIIRTRNMDDKTKIASTKWQRVAKTVEWLSTQLPITSQFQIWSFSDEVSVRGADGVSDWQEVADRDALDEAVLRITRTVPANGTNLQKVFSAAAELRPAPDNIFLITDGLPTIGVGSKSGGIVSPEERIKLFEAAVDDAPGGVPFNVILMPLEGDPSAAAAYWQLAQISKGSFLAPSRDWP